MEEQNNVIEQAVEELKSSDNTKLKEVIELWFERTRTDGLRIGARYVSAVVAGTIEKCLKKDKKPSLRDYQRCIDKIIKIISVQLTQQNDLLWENEDEQESSV